MEITIEQNKKLSDIQVEFQKRFPFLKLEFYKDAHASGEGSAKAKTLNSNLTIAEAQSKAATGSLIIQGLMTVAELESAFSEVYGLSVQVFRKSGQVWLQTTVTDNWTLSIQNQKAMEKHEAPKDSAVDAMDRMELE